MDELNLKIILLEEEMLFLRQQIEQLKKGDSDVYQQILAKYNQPEKKIVSEKRIVHENIEYVVDDNRFVWDLDGYRVGEFNEGNIIFTNDI